MATKKQNDKSLEEILARLDEIADTMNSKLPLSDALELYKEGAHLVVNAKKLLDEAKAEIKVVTEKTTVSDGENDDE